MNPVLTFLRNPSGFASNPADPDIWMEGLRGFAEPRLAAAGEHPLRDAQIAAWGGLADARAGLVLGPPGTGKTHLLAWMICGYAYARRARGETARIFVSAFTRNAIGNLLDAVAKIAAQHCPGLFDVHFMGGEPPAGLSPDVRHRPSVYGKNGADALQDIAAPCVVVGATVWTLNLLVGHRDAGGDGGFAPLFDLVCIDEASQLVLSHGLMALAGITDSGRVIVAGDYRQLPPIRAARPIEVDGRALGGSLYAFLKSGGAPEFALEETFRLNGPLTAFPEQKFYKGQYRSAVEGRLLQFVPDWRDGLEEWETLVLDPSYPVVVIAHDGPTSATQNDLEASLAAHLARRIAERLPREPTDHPYPAELWRDNLAIVSPHRAQNSAIRNALPAELKAGAFVETVDRIQGKERDVVLLSYCVADPEFAVAEAEFIFSPERLNVAITRARSKLIVLVSRRLLAAIPTDQTLMDNAELLREFVFGCPLAATVALPSGAGTTAPAQIRVRGHAEPPALRDLASEQRSQDAATGITHDDRRLFETVKACALASKFGTATISALKQRLATNANLFPGLARLHAAGLISLRQQTSPQYGPFWTARPLEPARHVYAAEFDVARARLEEVISQTRRGRMAPFYTEVRDRFAWMDANESDVLRPILDRLRSEGLVTFGAVNNGLTIDWVGQPAPAEPDTSPPEPDLSDGDFHILNALETLEARRINFGVFEGWTSVAALAAQAKRSSADVGSSVSRLAAAGWLMRSEGLVRSRFAELAREVRYVKQRFRRDDAHERPYLVRSLKVELRDRDKPERKEVVSQVFASLAQRGDRHWRDAVEGMSAVLEQRWGEKSTIAGFQRRSLEWIANAWAGEGENALVIAADTGAGKTEAAALPIIICAAADAMAGIRGVRAVLTYPRIRLAANQAHRLADYLAALAQQPGMPTLTIGLQTKDVPTTFDRLWPDDIDAGWRALSDDTFAFPVFACPKCEQPLTLRRGKGVAGADLLECVSGDWRFGGWVGSKSRIREAPPALFLPTTESLHQWLHDPAAGRLFGDDPNFAPPRLGLADEIHLYANVHGAQVGLALRRLAARIEMNGPGSMLAVGMSATLGDPARAWGRLIGRKSVAIVTPNSEERKPNPRGREYFMFVQPEVESRGHDIAGASTTIQGLMCLAHGMRRRTGRQGGFRSLVFLDSIDKVRRLHGQFEDAESASRLHVYRTAKFGTDPITGAERDGCCGEPFGCDAFRDGECWYFAANDPRQRGAGGVLKPGAALRVADRPVTSQAGGGVEAMIKDSDVVFATSSLEVGYDDPEISLVYQHYAPRNLASFIQRKGRGGRGSDDRPLTAVTLSLYSSRDSWWFKRPHEMISPRGFDTPMNPDNHFVRRGQLVASILDAFARWERRSGQALDLRAPHPEALRDAEALAIAALSTQDPWREFGFDGLAELWDQAIDRASAQARAKGKAVVSVPGVREHLDWVPNALFDTINLPRVSVAFSGDEKTRSEDIAMMLTACAPGNATRRFSQTAVYWRPPVQGTGPWLAQGDYEDGEYFEKSEAFWRASLPDDALSQLQGLGTRYFRPRRLSLELLGKSFGTGWKSHWCLSDDASLVAPDPDHVSKRHITSDARGSLRGFPIISVDPDCAQTLSHDDLRPWLSGVEQYVGSGLGGGRTGLALARMFWGADSEIVTAGPPRETATFTQTFSAPGSARPLLHGYHVHTEGVRFHVDTQRLNAVIADQVERMKEDEATRRWHAGQMLRYLIDRGAQEIGVNAYEAQRAAELLVSAAGDPDLKRDLSYLRQFWSQTDLQNLFERTRATLLSQHPLLTERRVRRVAESLGNLAFQDLFNRALAAIGNAAEFQAYLRTCTLHALGVRLKESFLQTAKGDERQVILHLQLPMQFGERATDTITICEAGAFGDGTTRAFVERFEEARAHWRDGLIGECPNAREDVIMGRLLARRADHEAWRALNPLDPDDLEKLSRPLGLAAGEAPPASVLRVLYGTESIGSERFDLYDLAIELNDVEAALRVRLGREPSAWELTSSAVSAATSKPGTASGKLLAAYAGLDHAALDESLSPESRLADQIYRMHARLCVDGCNACVHQPSDLMSDAQAQASTSRRFLQAFLEA